MDDYTKRKLVRLLQTISPEELQNRALLAKNADDRRLWQKLSQLKQQQTVRQ